MTLDRRAMMKALGLGVTGLRVASFPVRVQANSGLQEALPRSAPEAQGVSSAGILDFLDAAKSINELHSFMLVRHGHVVAESWWTPYRPDAIHTLYSLSKSFTSTAVGFAVSEGKLNIADPVVRFFPDKLPVRVSDNLAHLRVSDLLTMSVGHASDSTMAVIKGVDWVSAFLSTPIEHEPGSVFLYDSSASYILSAIVQKVAGQRVIDYLTPRLFEPLGVSGMTWENCPLGINCGGWGLSATTETLAKFGQLYLQKGAWNGRRILPAEWIEQATTFKIQQPPKTGIGATPNAPSDPSAALRKLQQTSDWHQGYCYQFWRCRHNAFRGDGAFGQYCVVMPEQDAVIAITSETNDMQRALDLVWTNLLPAFRANALPDDAPGAEKLRQQLASSALPPPAGASSSATLNRILGKTFKLEPNSINAGSASIGRRGERYVFSLKHADGTSEVLLGMGGWVDGKTDMPGVPPTPIMRNTKQPGPFKVAAAGAWKDDRTFEMHWRYYETPHRDLVVCGFHDDQVEIRFTNSITQLSGSHAETRPLLRGRIVA